jgi:hypothetical protein
MWIITLLDGMFTGINSGNDYGVSQRPSCLDPN